MFNQETGIHVSVDEQLIRKFEDDLTEGDAMVVQLFKVYPVVGDYRTSTHRFKIGFYQTTFLAKADDFPSEVHEKSFADYNDILGGKLDKTYLIGESISMPFIMH